MPKHSAKAVPPAKYQLVFSTKAVAIKSKALPGFGRQNVLMPGYFVRAIHKGLVCGLKTLAFLVNLMNQILGIIIPHPFNFSIVSIIQNPFNDIVFVLNWIKDG